MSDEGLWLLCPERVGPCPGIRAVNTQRGGRDQESLARVGTAGAKVLATCWVGRGLVQVTGTSWEFLGEPVLTLRAWQMGFGCLSL